MVRTCPSVIRLVRTGGSLVTTREVLAEESAMLERVQAGRGRYEEIRRGGNWTFLSPLLGDEQKKAVLKVLHSRDMVISVRGPAGSGKTLMMQEAVKAVAALSGRDVLVVAPSTSAVKVLKEQGFFRGRHVPTADAESPAARRGSRANPLD